MNSKYTEKMITENLMSLLNRIPLNKITVSKLADECGINRNTIYYHFKDLNEVIDTIFQQRLQKVLDETNENLSWEDSFVQEVEFALENKTAIYHIYHSVSRKVLSDYLYQKSGQIMTSYVERIDSEIHAKKEDKDIIIKFYQSAISDLALRWLASGMNKDMIYNIRKIGFLFKNSIKTALENSKSL